MAQIYARSYTQMRGKAYKCLHCPHIAEKKRITSHIYKDHIPLDKAPFYCRLCLFRSSDQDSLEKHVLPRAYPPHSQKVNEIESATGTQLDVNSYLMRSLSPYQLQEGVDYITLSDKDSEEIWRQRSKSQKPVSLSTTSPLDQSFSMQLPLPSSSDILHAQPLSFSRYPEKSLPTVPSSRAANDMSQPAAQIVTPIIPAMNTSSRPLGFPSGSRGPLQTEQSVPLHQTILQLSSRTSLMQSPPPVGRVELTENVLENILGSYNPNESISAPPTPQLPTEIMNILNGVSTSTSYPSTATTTATTTLTVPPLTTRMVESSTSPLPLPSDSQSSRPEAKAIVDAINSMTSSICDSINRQTSQFSMLRATLTTFLRRTEDRGTEVRRPYSPSPVRKRQLASTVYVPTKKRRTDN